MRGEHRELFDTVLDRVIEALPEGIRRLVEQDVALLVDDQPPADVLLEFGLDPADPDAASEILGLHSGVPLTEGGIETDGVLPPTVHLYRLGLLEVAMDGRGEIDRAELETQIRITLLHEIGHHFGLEEDDLDRLGFS